MQEAVHYIINISIQSSHSYVYNIILFQACHGTLVHATWYHREEIRTMWYFCDDKVIDLLNIVELNQAAFMCLLVIETKLRVVVGGMQANTIS